MCAALALFAAACGSSTTDIATGTTDAVADAGETADAAMAVDEDADAGETADAAMAMDDDGDAMAMDDEDPDAMAMDDDGMAMDDDAMHDGKHGHGGPMEVAEGLPTPSVTVEATADPRGGWIVHAMPTNHRIAPENASTDAVDGEGHMHLFVDGERIGRIYNEWVQVPALGEGTHEITVELSANNHSALAIDGEVINDTVTVEEGAAEGGHHHGDGTYEVAADAPTPSVSIEVFEDPKSGWNVHAVPTNHELNALAASTDAVEGEGHMHLYVGDTRITRLYGEWYHLADQTDGDHTIRVELSANNHLPLSVDGAIVEASTTITQVDGVEAMAMSDDDGHGDDDGGHDDGGHGDHGDAEMAEMADMSAIEGADTVISLAVADGAVSGDTGRVDVELGSTVGIVVDADITEQIHVHGYDVFADVNADQDAMFTFTADIPGLFEVELEGAGTLLVELAVR